MNVKDLFKKFVFAYIAAGHTQTDESEDELKRLIGEYIDTCDDEDCFDNHTMLVIIDYVKHNISDENKGFYSYHFNEFRYLRLLEDYIKHIINLFNKNNRIN